MSLRVLAAAGVVALSLTLGLFQFHLAPPFLGQTLPCGDTVCDANNGETCDTCPTDCGVCPPAEPVCGSNGCEAGENCSNCSEDCGCALGQYCSGGSCHEAPQCGSNGCESAGGENCSTCAQDCACSPEQYCNAGTCTTPSCGNSSCEMGETCISCSADCACTQGQYCSAGGVCTTPACGSNGCETGETCATCLADCPCGNGQYCSAGGSCITPECGNSSCERSGGENCTTCYGDCPCAAGEGCEADNVCHALCGNGREDWGENCTTCPADFPCETGYFCNANNQCVTPQCSNGSCEPGENCGTCLNDCPCGMTQHCYNNACAEGYCGNGTCDGSTGESCSNCITDCGVCIVCGDGLCNGGETCSMCSLDCGACPPSCGDGTCNGDETCSSCSMDCDSCAVCGDGLCTGDETCSSCSWDCGTCGTTCGDWICNSPSENCNICPQDCGVCSGTCGDGHCGTNEYCDNCPYDCGSCTPQCGDGLCLSWETCGGCPIDCGLCGPVCGDGICDATELLFCPQDCYACGDGSCDFYEWAAGSCPIDCLSSSQLKQLDAAHTSSLSSVSLPTGACCEKGSNLCLHDGATEGLCPPKVAWFVPGFSCLQAGCSLSGSTLLSSPVSGTETGTVLESQETPRGACCSLAFGNCLAESVTQADCGWHTFHAGLSCDDAGCNMRQGFCCWTSFGGNLCSPMNEDACDQAAGTFATSEEDCQTACSTTSTVLNVVSGTCCFPDAGKEWHCSGEPLPSASCADAGGLLYADAESCRIECAKEPSGYCCLNPSGEDKCTFVSGDFCTSFSNGILFQDETSCAASCVPTPTEQCNYDGVCNEREDCSLCPADCGSCAPVCGDGTCSEGEERTCEVDCRRCGDGSCDIWEKQAETCPADCNK